MSAARPTRCPGCGRCDCPHPRLECGGEAFGAVSDVPFRTYITSDDVLMVSIEDVLTWLRGVERAWDGTHALNTGDAVSALADDLRDAWLDGAAKGVAS